METKVTEATEEVCATAFQDIVTTGPFEPQ